MLASSPTPFVRRVGDLLASPRARIFVLAAGIFLTLPSLTNGLLIDDIVQRATARGAFGGDLWLRLDLFQFVPASLARKASLYEDGFLPWFSVADLRIAFFRPIASALHFFDYTVLDRWPWMMHAESVAIYAAVIALVAALYRRVLPLGVAMLAALLYAIDDAHGFALGWLASRNGVIATAFGLAAIVAHDRWRRDGWKPGAVLAPLAFLTALLSAELGLGSLAYLVAHAATLDPAPRRKRAWVVAPYLAIVIAWQVVYRKLGYGSFGSQGYADPVGDTVGFLRAVPERAGALLVGQLAVPPSDVFGTARTVGARAAVTLASFAFIAFVGWVVAPRLRVDPVARFFGLGMLLALAPVVATYSSDRLLLCVGIGAFGLVALVIGDLREPAPTSAPPRARSTRALRAFWIAIHLVLAPLLLPVTVTIPGWIGRWSDRASSTVPAGPEVADEILVVTNAPRILMLVPLLFPRDPDRTAPKGIRMLAPTSGEVAVTREDARTVLVALAPDATPDRMMGLFRDRAHPLHVGDEADVPGMHAAVTRMDDRNSPVSVRYRFDRDLDDPSLRWIAWNGTSFDETKAPKIGERIEVGSP